MEESLIKQHGLTLEEFDRIKKAIGREPNLVELGIFSVMWSEHCCYKSSKVHLKNFPTTGPKVLQGPGENAGIIDIGDDLAVAFKIESHNHPSFIEPYQGAATGVGGILRDIFTMGARPVANLNSLHFGAADHERTPYLLKGVVAGIGGYGNCMGIPTVGGEAVFEECYNGNILVNAFTLGVMRRDKIFKAVAGGEDNPVILVGSKTGRDGIHGATMASDTFGKESEEKRPTVQVGDPFTEKKLMEACLEAFALEGAIVGIQDMGAAGFTCSSFEMSEKGNCGMELRLDQIPQREENMTPYEIMLSESQERMLLVAEKGRVEDLRKIFDKWELEFAVVGKVISEQRVRGVFRGEEVFDLPVAPITGEAPLYHRPVSKPAYLEDVSKQEAPEIKNYNETLSELLARPNICEKKSVWRQYDHSVGTGTVVPPGSNAAVMRVKENNSLLALTVKSKSRWVYLDPYWGAVHTMAEAGRNLACVGAVGFGVTDCLNFGNPENPEIMWQFQEACKGLAEACRQFETPVVGGNVSLYNETEGKSIWPTPTVAMVGELPRGTAPLGEGWKNKGDKIYLAGFFPDSLAGSEVFPSGKIEPLDFQAEKSLHRFLIDANRKKLLESAHDVGRGGLAVAFARCAIAGNIGADLHVKTNTPPEVFLFGEQPAPVVVSVKPSQEKALRTLAADCGVALELLGEVGGTRLTVNDWVDIDLAALAGVWKKENVCAV